MKFLSFIAFQKPEQGYIFNKHSWEPFSAKSSIGFFAEHNKTWLTKSFCITNQKLCYFQIKKILENMTKDNLLNGWWMQTDPVDQSVHDVDSYKGWNYSSFNFDIREKPIPFTYMWLSSA